MGHKIRIFRCSSYSEVEGIVGDFNAISWKSLDRSPFILRDWLEGWCDAYQEGRMPVIYVVEVDGNHPIIAPFTYNKYRILNIPYYKLEFINPVWPYHSFIISDFKGAKRSIKPLMDEICNDLIGVSGLDFQGVPEDSYTKLLLDSAYCDGVKYTPHPNYPAYYLDVLKDWELYLAGLSKKTRKGFRHAFRKARKDFNVEFIEHTEYGSLRKSYDKFIQLHQKRWKKKNVNGLFADDNYLKFHKRVAEKFNEKKILSLHFLLFDSEPIAAINAFEFDGKVFTHLHGFDPDYADYSPGHLVINSLIQDSIEKGMREFDMMRGNEPYKRRYKPTARVHFEYIFYKNGLQNLAHSCRVHLDFRRLNNLYNVVSDRKTLVKW